MTDHQRNLAKQTIMMVADKLKSTIRYCIGNYTTQKDVNKFAMFFVGSAPLDATGKGVSFGAAIGGSERDVAAALLHAMHHSPDLVEVFKKIVIIHETINPLKSDVDDLINSAFQDDKNIKTDLN